MPSGRRQQSQSEGNETFPEEVPFNPHTFRFKETFKKGGAFLFRKNYKKLWKYIQNIRMNREPETALNKHRKDTGGGWKRGKSDRTRRLKFCRAAHETLSMRVHKEARLPTVKGSELGSQRAEENHSTSLLLPSLHRSSQAPGLHMHRLLLFNKAKTRQLTQGRSFRETECSLGLLTSNSVVVVGGMRKSL